MGVYTIWTDIHALPFESTTGPLRASLLLVLAPICVHKVPTLGRWDGTFFKKRFWMETSTVARIHITWDFLKTLQIMGQTTY